MAATKSTRKPQTTAKRTRKPVEPVVLDRAAAISAGMRELTEVRLKARAKRDGVPAKHLIFTEWLKALLAGKSLDADTVAKKYPDVKVSTITVWMSSWRNVSNLPANGRGKEKQITAALKKLSA